MAGARPGQLSAALRPGGLASGLLPMVGRQPGQLRGQGLRLVPERNDRRAVVLHRRRSLSVGDSGILQTRLLSGTRCHERPVRGQGLRLVSDLDPEHSLVLQRRRRLHGRPDMSWRRHGRRQGGLFSDRRGFAGAVRGEGLLLVPVVGAGCALVLSTAVPRILDGRKPCAYAEGFSGHPAKG